MPSHGRRNPPNLNIVEAIYDPRLFGSLFKGISSWAAWIVFLKAVFAIPMAQTELSTYQQCTGRNAPPPGGAKEAYAIVGRRGGKSRIVSLAAVYIAAFCDFREYLSPGETGTVLVLARDKDQAKIVFSYVRATLRSIPVLSKLVQAWRADEIELRNRITISIKPSDFRSVRGTTLCCAIADELAFWPSTGASPDVEVFQALRPAMATIPQSKLLCISSPYARFGQLFEAHRRYYGQDNDDGVLIWRAGTHTMNPRISESFIAAEIAKDPEAGRSEWMAEFRADIEQCFSLESIESCTIKGRTYLLPAQGLNYFAFVDASSGGGKDKFAVAVGHRKGEVAIVDLVRWWTPPFNPSETIAEVAEELKPFRIHAVTGDAYAGEFPREHFRNHGIGYELSQKNRSELYLALIPALNSKRVELPDIRQLQDELRRLERKRARSGKDSVDHPQYGSDDIANSVAGAVSLALAGTRIDTKQILLVGERITAGGPDGYGWRDRSDW